MVEFDKAYSLLRRFKGDHFIFGNGVLKAAGRMARDLGKRAAFVHGSKGISTHVEAVKHGLATSGLEVIADIPGAAPNAPLEDLHRISEALTACQPDVLVGFGAGSTLDCIKAAGVLYALGGDIEDYYGTGLVTQAVHEQGKRLSPFLAIQSAASSASHLTKYANTTNLANGQKKLIVDEAIVPQRAIFDYSVTVTCPNSLTADGGLDGISHCLEVFYGAVGSPGYDRVAEVAAEGIRLAVRALPAALADPGDLVAREALGLATDLGGYAIMLGDTNFAHLTSVALVDILSHGRATGLLNAYSTIFFAPAVEAPLRVVGEIYRDAGYGDADLDALSGRALGAAVAEAMLRFIDGIGVPTTLGAVPGFGDEHIERALKAAKNPQRKMKLQNMPIGLTAETVDDYIGPILLAAKTGDLSLIRNV